MISETMQVEPFDTMESITERALDRAKESGYPQRFSFDWKVYEAYPSPDGIGRIQLLMEYSRPQEETVGGNYNEFPWVDKGRSSWESKREKQQFQKANKEAAYRNLEALKAAQQKQLSDERRSKSLGPSPRPLLTNADIAELTKRYYALRDKTLQPRKVYWSGPVTEDWGTTMPTYGGISRSQNPEQEVLRLREYLNIVDAALGRHLREQLLAAPSQGSVYASGPGYAVTAFQIRQVVQALDSFKGAPSPWFGVDIADPDGDYGFEDFSATSEDGEKIVLTKDGDRFESGVLFDPEQRPIRKFKLKELPA